MGRKEGWRGQVLVQKGNRARNRRWSQEEKHYLKRYLINLAVWCISYSFILYSHKYLIKHIVVGYSFGIGFVLLEMKHIAKFDLKAETP